MILLDSAKIITSRSENYENFKIFKNLFLWWIFILHVFCMFFVIMGIAFHSFIIVLFFIIHL